MAEPSITAQVAALQKMSVAMLRKRWLDVFGEPTRQRHRRFLIKRLAAAIQNDTGPKLTAEEETKVEEYRAMLRQMPPEKWFPGKQCRPRRKPKKPPQRRELTPGNVVTKMHDGQEIAVTVREDGFEWQGQVYRSLSAVAKEVTGTTWNGWRWFGLDKKGSRK